MIRVSVVYPTAAETHMALVHARLGSLGLRRTEVDKGLGGGASGAPAPYAAMKAHGKELFDDVPNFTDITPQVQISEIIA